MTGFLGFARARLPQLRLVFFCVVLVCILYYLAWKTWEWSNVPGLVMQFGSYPWSWPWLEFGLQPGRIPWNTRDAITLAFLSFGFAFNCVIVYALGAWLLGRRRAR